MMRTTILTGLALCLLPGPSAWADLLVAYSSTQGWASGISESRQNGESIFNQVPASLRLSYTYDAGIQGVTQNGVTTFQVDTLMIGVAVPGYFSGAVSPFSTDVPGKIIWSGDTIEFNATLVVLHGEPPSLTIDVTFIGSPLTHGVLPQSLNGLDGILGNFTVEAQPSLSYHGDGGSLGGEVVSAAPPPSVPEPSTYGLFALGAAGFAACIALTRSHCTHTDYRAA